MQSAHVRLKIQENVLERIVRTASYGSVEVIVSLQPKVAAIS